jgi:ABC-type Mn2+/Zn2+ transport system ATPase subunit
VIVIDVPDLLVLDEPTAALNRASSRAVWSTVRDAAADGAAVLLTTNDLAEANALLHIAGCLEGVVDRQPYAPRGTSMNATRSYHGRNHRRCGRRV